MQRFKNGRIRVDAEDIANAFDGPWAPLTEGGLAVLKMLDGTPPPGHEHVWGILPWSMVTRCLRCEVMQPDDEP